MHTPEKEPFFAPPDAGDIPFFNEIFVFYWFHAFIKFSNVKDVFAPRNGQAYNSLLERKHADMHDMCSGDYIINEHTIALLILCMISSLDVGLGLRREKMPVYERTVHMLMMADGLDGRLNWRSELAEVLTKWHDTFKHVNKSKRDSSAGLVLSPAQVVDDPRYL